MEKYKFLTIEEVAEILNIGRNSAYNLIKNGEIKSFKIGNRYKIPSIAIDEYINRMTGLPVPLTHGVKYDT